MKLTQTIALFKEINEGLLLAKLSIGNKVQLVKLAEDLQSYIKEFEQQQQTLITDLDIKIGTNGEILEENPFEIKKDFIEKYNILLEEEIPFDFSKYTFDLEAINKLETETIPINFIKIFITPEKK
jgi:hypothetical protein